jgi:hypothetical protein
LACAGTHAACVGTDPVEPGGTSGSGGATSTGVTVSAGAGGESATSGVGSGGSSPGLPFSSEGDTDYQAEPFVVLDGNGGVVVAWLGFESYQASIGYAVSRDGGDTWTEPARIEAPSQRLSSAPVLAADSEGEIFLAWAGFHTEPTAPDEHVYLSRLDPIGEIFTVPAIASDDGISTQRDFDKPWIITDASDDLLLTWADFTGFSTGTPPTLAFARSSDGAAFARSTIAGDAGFGNLAFPCLDRAAGTFAPVYVVHLAPNGGLTLERSDNGGTSFTPHAVPVTSVLFQDPRCVVSGDDVWITYASGTAFFSPSQNPPADEVRVIHSSDGGQTFGPEVTVSDGDPGTQYLFPQLVRTGVGALEVVYYQGKVGSPGQLVRASSSDGSAWATSIVADVGTFTVDRTTPDWLGDYLGLAAAGDALVVAYANNESGDSHIRFSKLE